MTQNRYDQVAAAIISVSEFDGWRRILKYRDLRDLNDTEVGIQWLRRELKLLHDNPFIVERSNATRADIRSAINELSEYVQASTESLTAVIVYFVGHAVPHKDSENLLDYLAFLGPGEDEAAGQEELKTAHDFISSKLEKAHHRLFIYDCCHSGRIAMSADSPLVVDPPYFKNLTAKEGEFVVLSSSADQNSYMDNRGTWLTRILSDTRRHFPEAQAIDELIVNARKLESETIQSMCFVHKGEGRFIFGVDSLQSKWTAEKSTTTEEEQQDLGIGTPLADKSDSTNISLNVTKTFEWVLGKIRGVIDPGIELNQNWPIVPDSYWRETTRPVLVIPFLQNRYLTQDLRNAIPGEPIALFLGTNDADYRAWFEQHGTWFSLSGDEVPERRVSFVLHEGHEQQRELRIPPEEFGFGNVILVTDQTGSCDQGSQTTPQLYDRIVSSGRYVEVVNLSEVQHSDEMNVEIRGLLRNRADRLWLKSPSPSGTRFDGEFIAVRPLETAAEGEQVFSLRQAIYRMLGYIHADDSVSYDIDEYDLPRTDGGAIHLVALYKNPAKFEAEEVIGCLRLVLAHQEQNAPTTITGGITECLSTQRKALSELCLKDRSFHSLPVYENSNVPQVKRSRAAEVTRLCVAPRFQGLDVATLLMRSALMVCSQLGKDKVFVECIPEHVGFYDRFGFAPVEGVFSNLQRLNCGNAQVMQLRMAGGEWASSSINRSNMNKVLQKMMEQSTSFPVGGPCVCSIRECWRTGDYSLSDNVDVCPARKAELCKNE